MNPIGIMMLGISAIHVISTDHHPHDTEPIPWGYDNTNWASLSPDYATCDTGKQQSPINIANPVFLNGRVLNLSHDAVSTTSWPQTPYLTHLTHSDSAHSLAIGPFSTQAIPTLFKNVTYHLTHIHLHTPSEHRVHGEFFAGEVHMVHQSIHGQRLVMAVLLDIKTRMGPLPKRRHFLTPIIQALENHHHRLDQHENHVVSVNIESLKQGAHGFKNGFYTYEGSLTTPPCTEGVRWVIAQDRVTVNPYQFEVVKRLIKFNARPVQP